MNRRSFLKRMAAVAAGAVIIPTVLKSELPFKFNHAQQLIIGGCDKHIKWQPVTLTMWDEIGHVPKDSCIYF